jgi:hypothetical protein
VTIDMKDFKHLRAMLRPLIPALVDVHNTLTDIIADGERIETKEVVKEDP